MIDKTVKLGKHELISLDFFTGGKLRIKGKYGSGVTLEEDETRDLMKAIILTWGTKNKESRSGD